MRGSVFDEDKHLLCKKLLSISFLTNIIHNTSRHVLLLVMLFFFFID